MPITNLGAQRILGWAFGETTLPLNGYFYLLTNATAPAVDDDTAAGYTHASNPGTEPSTPWDGTDIDVNNQVDASDYGNLQFTDKVWTASGGDCTARYVILADNVAYGSITEVYCSWDLGSDKTFSADQTLTVADLELRITTV